MTKEEQKITENDVKEWFKKRKENIKENKILMKLKDEHFSKNDVPARASWVAMFSYVMVCYLEEIYELLEGLCIELVGKDTENSNYNAKLDDLKETLKKHEPDLNRLRTVFSQVDKWIENGK